LGGKSAASRGPAARAVLLRSRPRSIPFRERAPESDQVIEHLGTAFPVYLNFAVSGMERLLREVRAALHRRQREETQARRSVEQQVRSEVCESLTAMLLSCELDMAVPEVPAPAAEKIRLIDNLARDMRLRLGSN